MTNGNSGGAEGVLGLLPCSSLSVTYHSQFSSHDDLMLLEVDEKLLPEFLLQRVTLRGGPDEDAVLCTESKTYAIKFVGTSNSVFLIPPPDLYSEFSESNGDGNIAVASVLKVAPGCMELAEVAPKLDQLQMLLSHNPYGFVEASEMEINQEDEKKKTGIFTWDDLVCRIQASDEELRMGLKLLSAIEIDGYWRTLDNEYMNRIINFLLHNITLNGWSFNSLNRDEVLAGLQADGFPLNVVSHVFELFCIKKDDELCTWKLNEERICVHLAREILIDGKMKMDIFMDKWTLKIPSGITASFDMLKGEVLTEKLGMDTWVYLFSVSSLPSTPADRFSKLFNERSKWGWKDLEPFVRDLKVPGLSLEGLLLKYTRRTQPNVDSEPVFSSR